MTRREKERKIKMFGMIGMSLLVIASLATATYAWFTKIVATVNTGTMTVVAPDEYSYYAYNGNDPNWDSAPNGTFGHDFVQITNENKASLTSFTDVYPGQSKIYCIEIASKNPEKTISLAINSFISNNSTKQGLAQKRYIEGETTEINIGSAIDITAMASPDGSGYYDNTLHTGWLVDTNPIGPLAGDVFNPTISKLSEGTQGSPVISLGENPITIFEEDGSQDEWASLYLFFRVYFSDATTTLYGEINTTDGYNVPKASGPREFVLDPTNGTSNCYAGLKFQLVNLTLNF